LRRTEPAAFSSRLQRLLPLGGSLFGSSGEQAEAQAPRDNLIEQVLSTEFDPRSLDGLSREKQVKYTFEMKSRE